MDAIVALAIEQPAFGQVRVANELRKRGLVVTHGSSHCAGGVGGAGVSLHSSFHSDKLSETTDRCSLFR
jgi:hypothetical protein